MGAGSPGRCSVRKPLAEPSPRGPSGSGGLEHATALSNSRSLPKKSWPRPGGRKKIGLRDSAFRSGGMAYRRRGPGKRGRRGACGWGRRERMGVVGHPGPRRRVHPVGSFAAVQLVWFLRVRSSQWTLRFRGNILVHMRIAMLAACAALPMAVFAQPADLAAERDALRVGIRGGHRQHRILQFLSLIHI